MLNVRREYELSSLVLVVLSMTPLKIIFDDISSGSYREARDRDRISSIVDGQFCVVNNVKGMEDVDSNFKKKKKKNEIILLYKIFV